MLIHSIIPAIIPSSEQHLGEMLGMVSAFAGEVQIDIVDGKFTSPASWPYADGPIEDVLSAVRFNTIFVELDLMIERPEETLDLWQATGARKIVVHVESTTHMDVILAHKQAHGYELGVALCNDTDLSILDTLNMAAVDYIQLMGIARIGKQGQPFDERVLERLGAVKAKYPEKTASIDGAVNRDTLQKLKAAGADRAVVGSAILNAEDPNAAYEELCALL